MSTGYVIYLSTPLFYNRCALSLYISTWAISALLVQTTVGNAKAFDMQDELRVQIPASFLCQYQKRNSVGESRATIGMNVYINLRDELIVIDTEMVAYVKANSNYSDVFFIKGGKITLSMTLSKVESLLRLPYSENESDPFAHIGRSLLINQKYLVHIDVLKGKLLLSDYEGHSHQLPVSKSLLKKYKKSFSAIGLGQ